ncbi:hypothetical protein [Myxococcus xanthus]|uniref:hypothetical protein n=1 Tax=Myxococcus xanthus TaxID=34 RepID=UPI0011629242|nr:hypothetical protein [Myxococcus xanthus]QDF03292.1 hypothetical protein BHS04_08715 [Myxococcus xanthus]
MPTFRLKQDQAALLVVDIQERLCAALSEMVPQALVTDRDGNIAVAHPPRAKSAVGSVLHAP